MGGLSSSPEGEEAKYIKLSIKKEQFLSPKENPAFCSDLKTKDFRIIFGLPLQNWQKI